MKLAHLVVFTETTRSLDFRENHVDLTKPIVKKSSFFALKLVATTDVQHVFNRKTGQGCN